MSHTFPRVLNLLTMVQKYYLLCAVNYSLVSALEIKQYPAIKVVLSAYALCMDNRTLSQESVL
jgi:hypothetical protein